MLKQFEDEWHDRVGPIDNHGGTDQNMLNISKCSARTSHEKIVIKKKINEFESV